ncbi:fumarylacetoacetate hydrolase family protein [Streptomyces sp. G44]|uniref:2-keto-4-pentenoate hydratase n=1 Tax=Streptomyces sp. G44 TaxID=2807632 RepID=UPI00195F29B4|nr:fumarylacetoacetate hydrolase family protein [Streptomyces sp. G44]MBM7172974.1 fumarylacetoacetate hydrolase family protein [Streptomyces sp. G44]
MHHAPHAVHEHLADELWNAKRERKAIPPISGRYPEFTAQDAYAVQHCLRTLDDKNGAVHAGYKIGATSVAIQEMFGVDQPDFGFLTEDMLLPDGACLDTSWFIAPKVEGEIAFRIGADLSGPRTTAADVLAVTTEVYPALEVLDSRIANWDIAWVDTVADNASSAMVVVGAAVPFDGRDLAAETMVFASGDSVQTARGSAVLGHPAESVACLVRMLASFGAGIGAGDLILAGSLAAAVDLEAGAAVRASFGSLGSVSLSASSNCVLQ